MLKLAGYKVDEPLHSGRRSEVYRGTRLADGKPVVLKTLVPATASAQAIGRFRYSYAVTQGIDVQGVCRMLELLGAEQTPVLVMEDRGCGALEEQLGEGGLPVETALKLGIQVASALGKLHQQRIVHRDINPSNLIVTPDLSQAEIIDFDMASRLVSETADVAAPDTLEGTLAYMSPEQTGRVNRSVDHRSDLYSLGVTLYQMFSGRLPFEAADAMGFVHRHIAVAPIELAQVNPRVPPQVSRIVMKLLAKTPEDRYQSAFGLAEDLRRCLAQHEAGGAVEAFELGAHDLSPRLNVSQILYGRSQEVAELLAAFDKIVASGAQLLLVAGYSGVGKSRLVNEIHKPITDRRGAFIEGKYNQYQNIPYAGLIQAFRQMTRDILTQPEAEVARWKERLLDALGGVAQVIIDVVPELAAVVGPQPQPPPMPPAEAQNRFQLTFLRFAHAFVAEGRPLVLFLDDLQWADSSSLNLVRLLLTDPHSDHILILGAYRDNEVQEGHVLSHMLSEIKAAGAEVRELKLEPLDRKSTEHLVADTLRCSVAEGRPLSDIVYSKTRGNPFFVERLLRMVHEEGALAVDQSAERWTWDLAHIEGMGIAEHVADLMAREIRRLPEATQQVLQPAACIGAQFSLGLLCAALDRDVKAVADALWTAVQEELIAPVGDAYRLVGMLGDAAVEPENVLYRFVHDRIQEAAYEQVSVEQRRQMHLRIGKHLLASTKEERRADVLFDVVGHLNLCSGLLTEPAERTQLAEQNLLAGQRAMRSAAYNKAVEYLNAGVELLGEDAWNDKHDLAYSLHRYLAEAAQMVGDFKRSERVFKLVLERSKTLAEQTEVHRLLLTMLITLGDHDRAINTGLEGLKLFGWEIPADTAGWWALNAAKAAKVGELMAGMKVEDLANSPAMTDEKTKLEMSVLIALAPISTTRIEVCSAVVSQMVILSIVHGNDLTSPIGFVFYAFFGAAMGNYAYGDAFGRLALEVNRKQGSVGSAPIHHMYGCYVHHICHPYSDSIEHTSKGLVLALEAGIFNTVGWAAMNMPWLSLAKGLPLAKVYEDTKRYLDMGRNLLKYNDLVSTTRGTMAQIARLIGDREEIARLSKAEGPPTRAIEELSHYPMAQVPLVNNAVQVHCILGEYEEALPLIVKGNALLPAGTSLIPVHEFPFYKCLVYLAMHGRVPEETSRGWAEEIASAKAFFEALSKLCPENHLYKLRLIEAESARVAGDERAALEAFEAAIAAAEKGELAHAEAMSCELAGSFLLSIGRKRAAVGYLMDARNAYLRWGAMAKVRAMEDRHPILRVATSGSAGGHTSVMPASALDIGSIIKASQAISSEIQRDELLRSLMRTVVENAGAQRGCLVLKTDRGLMVEAVVEEAKSPARVLLNEPLSSEHLPESMVHYVLRSRESLVLGNAGNHERFGSDPHVLRHKSKSTLCLPILKQGNPLAVLYLENNLVPDAFSPERVTVLEMLSSQVAISLENAQLFAEMEERVASRTAELRQKNEDLERTLSELKTAQTQLIHSEKMASLGRLSAGVAHELKNPLNFIINFASSNEEIASDLLDNPPSHTLASVRGELEEIKSASERITHHGVRADSIIRGLTKQSDIDSKERSAIDVNALLEQYLNVVHRGAVGTDDSAVLVGRDYGRDIGEIEVQPQQLARAFMSVLSNAFDAVLERKRREGEGFRPRVDVATWREDERLRVRIADNGAGIAPEIRGKVFEPFFTTKPPGSGTGLGLSVCHDIIRGHGGDIEVEERKAPGASILITIPVNGPARASTRGRGGDAGLAASKPPLDDL